MTLSASPMTYHEGIVFHPTASGVLSVKQRAANGRCVAANRAATSAGSADANPAPKYLALTYRSAPAPADVVNGTAIVKSGGGGGALASSDSTDSPASGANASTYTSAFTLGALAEATLITEPPYEWPARTTGPGTDLR